MADGSRHGAPTRDATTELQLLLAKLPQLTPEQLGQLLERATAMRTARSTISQIRHAHQGQAAGRSGPRRSEPGRRSVARALGGFAGDAVNVAQRLANRISRWWNKPNRSTTTIRAQANHDVYTATRQNAVLNRALRGQGISGLELATAANLAYLAAEHPDQQVREAAEQQFLDRMHLQDVYEGLATSPITPTTGPGHHQSSIEPHTATEHLTPEAGPTPAERTVPGRQPIPGTQPVPGTQSIPGARPAFGGQHVSGQQQAAGDRPAPGSGFTEGSQPSGRSLAPTRLLLGFDHLQTRPADTFLLPAVEASPPDTTAPSTTQPDLTQPGAAHPDAAGRITARWVSAPVAPAHRAAKPPQATPQAATTPNDPTPQRQQAPSHPSLS